MFSAHKKNKISLTDSNVFHWIYYSAPRRSPVLPNALSVLAAFGKETISNVRGFHATSLIIDCTLLLFWVHHYKSQGPPPRFPLSKAGCCAQIQSVEVRLCEFAECFPRVLIKLLSLNKRAFQCYAVNAWVHRWNACFSSQGCRNM